MRSLNDFITSGWPRRSLLPTPTRPAGLVMHQRLKKPLCCYSLHEKMDNWAIACDMGKTQLGLDNMKPYEDTLKTAYIGRWFALAGGTLGVAGVGAQFLQTSTNLELEIGSSYAPMFSTESESMSEILRNRFFKLINYSPDNREVGVITKSEKQLTGYHLGIAPGPDDHLGPQDIVCEPERDPWKQEVGSLVFFDVSIQNTQVGRIKIALFKDIAPKAVRNFEALAAAETVGGKTIGYEGTIFHRIVPGLLIQGGDVSWADGTGGMSIYGRTFEDEDQSKLRHTSRGMVMMANTGRNTNSSQFFITLIPTPYLEGTCTPIGLVVSKEGINVLKQISTMGTKGDPKGTGTPTKRVLITASRFHRPEQPDWNSMKEAAQNNPTGTP